MSSRTKHSIASCYEALERNGHQIILPDPSGEGPQVREIRTRGNIGIKLWGMIDYLVDHRAHHLTRM